MDSNRFIPSTKSLRSPLHPGNRLLLRLPWGLAALQFRLTMSGPGLRVLTFISLFSACSIPLFSQSASCDLYAQLKPAQVSGHSLCPELQKGFALNSAENYKAAVPLFEAAIRKASIAEDPILEAQAHRGLGNAFFGLSKFKEARHELEAAEASFQKSGDLRGLAYTHLSLGENAHYMGASKERDRLYAQALDEFEKIQDRHGVLTVRVYRLYVMNPSPEKKQESSWIEKEAESLGDLHVVAEAAHVEGDDDYSNGDYSQALDHYKKAEALFGKLREEQQLAYVRTSIGRLEAHHGEPQDALVYYRSALRLQRADGDHAGAVQSLNAIAVTYGMMDQVSESIAMYRRALAAARAMDSPLYVRFVLGNMALEFVEAGEYRASISLLKKVIAEEKSPYLLGYRYHYLADAEHLLGEDASALAAVNSALKYRAEDSDPSGHIESLLLRSKIESSLGDHAGALRDTQAASAILENLRSHLVANDYLKQGFAESTQKYYDTQIQIGFDAQSGDKEVATAEEGRARAFLDLLATRHSGDATRHGGPLSPGGEHDLEHVASDSTLSGKAFNVDQIVATAQRLHSTFLIYWSAKDELYIWVVPPDGHISSARVRVGRDKLQALVTRAANPGPITFTAGQQPALRRSESHDVWRALYSWLIAPVEDKLPRESGALLTIVPHGPLFRLPFAALRDAHSRYLLQRYALHYLPAGAVAGYTEMNHEAAERHSPKRLLVAESFVGEAGGRRTPLRGATAEVRAIAHIVGPSVELENNAASKASIVKEMGDATIVHFATHALLDDAQPLASYLALSQSPPAGIGRDQANDKLTAAEVYDLRIPADLVVLSACKTGLGKVTGDGMLGMTRAFFTAGASSVLASLWEVADRPTEKLMLNFYRNLENGQSKATALRNAQLQILHALEAGKLQIASPAGPFVLPADPRLWAGFVLEGNP